MSNTITNADDEHQGYFFKHFQSEVKVLQTLVHSLQHKFTSSEERNAALSQCMAGINQLSDDIKDASSYIPAYDQRTYSETIKIMSERLRYVTESFQPPKKFSFKTRKADNLTPMIDLAVVTRDHLSRNSTPSIDALESGNTTNSIVVPKFPSLIDSIDSYTTAKSSNGTEIRRMSVSPQTQVAILNHSNLHIAPTVSASDAPSSCTISHLAHCVVDLTAATANTPFATLYLKDISDSLIIGGVVAGPIHITEVVNSVLVIACRQFRMHDSEDVDVYLHTSSRPVIEECQGLRFAPLPETFSTPAIADSPNLWDQIDDFMWLKPVPSPHYSILAENERCGENVWKMKVVGAEDKDSITILQAVRRQ